MFCSRTQIPGRKFRRNIYFNEMHFTYRSSACKPRTHSPVCVSQTCQPKPSESRQACGGGWRGAVNWICIRFLPLCCLNIGSSPIHIHEWIIAVCKSSSERAFKIKVCVWGGGVPKDVGKFVVCKWRPSTRRRTVVTTFINPAVMADPD